MKRLYIFVLIVLMIVLIAGFIYRSYQLEQIHQQRINRELQTSTALLIPVIEPYIKQRDYTGLEMICKKTFGPLSDFQSRITVFTDSGLVLFDTWKQASKMENHLNRPEIQEVLKFNDSSYLYSRYSTTTEQKMLYCISPFIVDGNKFLLRVAIAENDLQAQVVIVQRNTISILLLAIMISIIVSYLLYWWLNRFSTQIAKQAAYIANGSDSDSFQQNPAGNSALSLKIAPGQMLSPTSRFPSSSAMNEIAIALGKISHRLEEQLIQYTREKNIRDSIFSSLAEGVILLDKNNDILDINDSACEMLGISGINVKGESLFAVFRYENLPSIIDSASAGQTIEFNWDVTSARNATFKSMLSGDKSASSKQAPLSSTALDDSPQNNPTLNSPQQVNPKQNDSQQIDWQLSSKSDPTEAKSSKESISASKLDFSKKNDTKLQVLLQVKPIQSDDIESGKLVVLYDITEIRKLENYRRDFVANVSHEIKTPLTVIMGTIEALENGAINDPEVSKSFLSTLTCHAKRLQLLLEDILTLSNLENYSVENKKLFVQSSLSDTVEIAIALCKPNAVKRNQKIVLDDTIQGKTYRFIPSMIEQALVNLINNAIKYSVDGDTIIVHLESEETPQRDFNRPSSADKTSAGIVEEPAAGAVIQVIDHGPGISAEHQPRIFERFYRVDASRSKATGGTGLGLAIVKHIAQIHHGTVSLQSMPQHGCTFTLTIR